MLSLPYLFVFSWFSRSCNANIVARELYLNDICGAFFVLAVGLILAIVLVAFDRLFLWLMLCCRGRGAPHLEFSKRYAATITRLVSEGVYIHIEFQTRDFLLPHAALNPNNNPPLTAEQLEMGIGENLLVQYFGKDIRGRKIFKVVGWKKSEEMREDNESGSDKENESESEE